MNPYKLRAGALAFISVGMLFGCQSVPVGKDDVRIELFLKQIEETIEGKGLLVDDSLSRTNCCRYVDADAPWYKKGQPKKIRLSASTLDMVRRELKKDPDFLPSPSYLMHSRSNEDGITFGLSGGAEVKNGKVSVILGSSRFLDISPDGTKMRMDVGF